MLGQCLNGLKNISNQTLFDPRLKTKLKPNLTNENHPKAFRLDETGSVSLNW